MKFIYSKEIVAARKAALIETFQAGKVHGIFPRLAAGVCSADPATTSHSADFFRSDPKSYHVALREIRHSLRDFGHVLEA